MSQTEVQTEKGTTQLSAVEQENLERLRGEKAEFEEEAKKWGKEEAKKYIKNAPYIDLKETVDTGRMTEDCDHIRDGIRESGYDETQVIRGFMEGVREVYEGI